MGREAGELCGFHPSQSGAQSVTAAGPSMHSSRHMGQGSCLRGGDIRH